MELIKLYQKIATKYRKRYPNNGVELKFVENGFVLDTYSRIYGSSGVTSGLTIYNEVHPIEQLESVLLKFANQYRIEVK